jgi:hypothetical protein
VALSRMSLYSPPPPARSFHDDKATLLVCWWCTCFAAVIILFRVCGRYIRTEKLFREDWLAFACLIPLLTRMALVHVVLLFGTNNTVTTGLSQEEISRRAIGSRLVLGSRIFYAATFVPLFYSNLKRLRSTSPLGPLPLSPFFSPPTFERSEPGGFGGEKKAKNG